MRLFCDEMLARLGRWLRAAGYDTAIAEGGLPNRALIARCAAEGRVLLTRDRHLAAVAAGRIRIVRLTETTIAAQAQTVRAVIGIDWQKAPFTRCLVDNTPLDPAPPEMSAQVPHASRAAGGPLHLCPECGRLYWPGGHVRRMLTRLASFASDEP